MFSFFAILVTKILCFSMWRLLLWLLLLLPWFGKAQGELTPLLICVIFLLQSPVLFILYFPVVAQFWWLLLGGKQIIRAKWLCGGKAFADSREGVFRQYIPMRHCASSVNQRNCLRALTWEVWFKPAIREIHDGLSKNFFSLSPTC